MRTATSLRQRRASAPRRRAKSASEPTARTSLVEQAYQAIRRRILDNVYPPGHQALEGELADQLGISRTPVREALIRLQKEGLVEVVPRHGMRVLPVSPADMAEIYTVLTALECAAAELVAARGPSERELKPLTEASRDMDRALKTDDLDAWAAADERFHRTLAELAGTDQQHRALTERLEDLTGDLVALVLAGLQLDQLQPAVRQAGALGDGEEEAR